MNETRLLQGLEVIYVNGLEKKMKYSHHRRRDYKGNTTQHICIYLNILNFFLILN